MFETGGGFRFATEPLQMCFGGPVTEADYFESYCAV